MDAIAKSYFCYKGKGAKFAPTSDEPVDYLERAVHVGLQVGAILIACRCLSILARRLGQPPVIAEMLAGICLGPSLFGLIWPEAHGWLFPWGDGNATFDTRTFLYPASQAGLALYMFIVGMEFRTDLAHQQLKSSVAVSVTGILTPLAFGAILAWWLFFFTDLFPSTISSPVAMLFLGAAMSITAFPVLARIIQFKKLGNTRMGAVALGAGAMDDAAAWGLLALLLASMEGRGIDAVANIGGGLIYVAVALRVIRPLLVRAEGWMLRDGRLTVSGVIGMLGLMSIGAWFTEVIGLHAVFGAFIMGAAMPRGGVSRDMIRRIQPLTMTLLIPLFFTYSGLSTKVNLLDTGFLWLVCGIVFLTAVLAKGGACWLAARASGIPSQEALGIGTLMNARGLMELIILNIGLQRGLISERLFAIMVIMAVGTTLMTSPVFDLLVRRRPPTIDEPETLVPVAPAPQFPR